MAHHELPQGYESGGLGEATVKADGQGSGDAGAGGQALDSGLTNARLEGMNGLFQAPDSLSTTDRPP